MNTATNTSSTAPAAIKPTENNKGGKEQTNATSTTQQAKKGRWLGGIFSKGEPAHEDADATEAYLGEPNRFYYDAELKEWVMEKKAGNKQNKTHRGERKRSDKSSSVNSRRNNTSKRVNVQSVSGKAKSRKSIRYEEQRDHSSNDESSGESDYSDSESSAGDGGNQNSGNKGNRNEDDLSSIGSNDFEDTMETATDIENNSSARTSSSQPRMIRRHKSSKDEAEEEQVIHAIEAAHFAKAHNNDIRSLSSASFNVKTGGGGELTGVSNRRNRNGSVGESKTTATIHDESDIANTKLQSTITVATLLLVCGYQLFTSVIYYGLLFILPGYALTSNIRGGLNYNMKDMCLIMSSVCITLFLLTQEYYGRMQIMMTQSPVRCLRYLLFSDFISSYFSC